MTYSTNRQKRKQQRRDYKINCQTKRLAESVLESVLGEKCKIIPDYQNRWKDDFSSESLPFNTDPSVWTITEADKEFLNLTSKPKASPKPKQMVPFFSIEGSFQPTAISDDEYAKFHAKWSSLLNESGIDPSLLNLIQPKEVQRRISESENNYVAQPDSRRMSLPVHHQLQQNFLQAGPQEINVRRMPLPMHHQLDTNLLPAQSDDETARTLRSELFSESDTDSGCMSLPNQSPGFDNNPRRMSLPMIPPGIEDESRRMSLPAIPPGFHNDPRRLSLPIQHQLDSTTSPTMDPGSDSTSDPDCYQHESRRRVMRPKPPVKQRGRSWRKTEDHQPAIEPFCKPMPLAPPVQHIPMIPVTTPDVVRNFLQQPKAQQQYLYPLLSVPSPNTNMTSNVIPVGLVSGFAPFYPFPKSVFETPEDAHKYFNACKNSGLEF